MNRRNFMQSIAAVLGALPFVGMLRRKKPAGTLTQTDSTAAGEIFISNETWRLGGKWDSVCHFGEKGERWGVRFVSVGGDGQTVETYGNPPRMVLHEHHLDIDLP